MKKEIHYSVERNTQMVVRLLKEFGIKNIIASPGATNVTLVTSLQHDPYFNMYSCVDERSAAYMACGMAATSEEPVVLSCTGATSARNYMPALTEAYYRNLPIICITSTRDESLIGHLIAQVTDRSVQPKDLVIDSVHIQQINTKNDEWDCSVKLNKVIQNAIQKKGPIHINLTSGSNTDYSVAELPSTKVIKRYLTKDRLPNIPANAKIGIFVGEHKKFTEEETSAIDRFCESYDAVVLCDHTSSYKGKYRIQSALIGAQDYGKFGLNEFDIIIHIGRISGDYDTMSFISAKKVWRIEENGDFKDTFKKLDSVFYMSELSFFTSYEKQGDIKKNLYESYDSLYKQLYDAIPELPLSNISVAKELAPKLPEKSVLYLGILNSLRSWNFFKISESIKSFSNVGGFGIDGILSSFVGSSLIDTENLHFCVLGDLSFFYDMNSLGNRSIGKNLRIIVINNGHGQEFCNYNHSAFLGDVDSFVAAGGHFGNKSTTLIKHYATDLGFSYIGITNKEDFCNVIDQFTDNKAEKSIVLEVFTNENDESNALKALRNLIDDRTILDKTKNKVKEILKENLNQDTINNIKKLVK